MSTGSFGFGFNSTPGCHGCGDCSGCSNGGVLDLYPCAGGIGTWRYDIAGDAWTSKTTPLSTHNPTGGWQACSVSAAFYHGYKNGLTVGFIDEYVDDAWTAKTGPPSVETSGLFCGDIAGTNIWAVQAITGSEKNNQYSVAGDSWSVQNAPTTYQSLPSIGNISDFLFVVGGTNSGGTKQSINSAYGLGAWTTGTSLPYAVTGQMCFTFYSRSFLHVVSGSTNSGITTNNYRYQSSSWTAKAASTNGHSQGTAYASNDEGVTSGGFKPSGGSAILLTDSYDPAGDAWTARATAPRSFEGFATGGI